MLDFSACSIHCGIHALHGSPGAVRLVDHPTHGTMEGRAAAAAGATRDPGWSGGGPQRRLGVGALGAAEAAAPYIAQHMARCCGLGGPRGVLSPEIRIFHEQITR